MIAWRRSACSNLGKVPVATPEGETPSPPDLPKGPASLLGELRALPELLASPAAGAVIAYLAPVGAPRPVLVIPGFISGDSATFTLRMFLRSLGHRPHGWGLGLNVGAAHHVAEGIDRALTELYEEYRTPIDIVGWSLGGIFGRLIAQHRPEDVRQVISMGSPLRISDPHDEVSDPIRIIGRLVGLEAQRRRHDIRRIPVPSTSIYSRHDGVVAPAACLQTPGPRSENIEVYGAHTGLGHNLAAVWVVADRLAQVDDGWAPFEVPERLSALFPDPSVIAPPDLRVVRSATG